MANPKGMNKKETEHFKAYKNNIKIQKLIKFTVFGAKPVEHNMQAKVFLKKGNFDTNFIEISQQFAGFFS